MNKKSFNIMPVKGTRFYDIDLPHVGIDCHLHRVNGRWIITCFSSAVANADKAYLRDIELDKGSRLVPNWNEVMETLKTITK